MGWVTIPGKTGKDLPDMLLRDFRNRLLPGVEIADTAVYPGKTLVWQGINLKAESGYWLPTKRGLVICLTHEDDCGYKDIGETGEPYFWDCPPALLEACPCPSGDNPWRRQMREGADHGSRA